MEISHASAVAGSSGSADLVAWLGIVVAALGIIVTILISRWQRANETRGKANDAHDHEMERRRSERHDEALLERSVWNEVWQADYQEIRDILGRADDLAFIVRKRGPLTITELLTLGLDAIAIDAEQGVSLGIPGVRDTLTRIAQMINELAEAALPDTATIVPAADRAPLAPEQQTHHNQRLAVLQDRAAGGLTAEIQTCRRLIRAHWAA
jgi:hypothetical protein